MHIYGLSQYSFMWETRRKSKKEAANNRKYAGGSDSIDIQIDSLSKSTCEALTWYCGLMIKHLQTMPSVFCSACRRAPLECQSRESGFLVARSLTIDRQGRVFCLYWWRLLGNGNERCSGNWSHCFTSTAYTPLVSWYEQRKNVQPYVCAHIFG